RWLRNMVFKPGAPGRPKGAKNKLTAQVLSDVFEAWNEPAKPGSNRSKGQAALDVLYSQEPAKFVSEVLKLMPKDIAIESVMADLTDSQLDEIMAKIKEQLLAAREEENEND